MYLLETLFLSPPFFLTFTSEDNQLSWLNL